MPKILNNYDPAIGPLVDVAIFKNPDGYQDDKNPAAAFGALIDTGASVTCISRKVITLCQLQTRGSAPLSGAAGITRVNFFTFGIGLIVPGQGGYEAEIIPITAGPEFMIGEQSPYQVLIGRDVICRGEFHISKNGTFELEI